MLSHIEPEARGKFILILPVVRKWGAPLRSPEPGLHALPHLPGLHGLSPHASETTVVFFKKHRCLDLPQGQCKQNAEGAA